ncbi:MAG: amino acid adenylation domain-containing protein [Clostridia bacterium]|nr:amino acid adenylation domain-containing protein [Clostridia bacterium]
MRTNILEYLEESAKRVPDKLAFSDGEESLTFERVLCTAQSLATGLLGTAQPGEPVAILMKRRPAQIVAFFACIYAACPYVPLDSSMPKERMELILSSVGAKYLIYDDEGKKALEGLGFSGDALAYDELAKAKINENILAKVRKKQIDTDPIYMVFTSGSTGVPKGVAACHRSVIDYTESLCEALPFSEDTVFGNQTPLFFDAPLKEIMPTIKYGATTYLIPKKLFLFPTRLCDFLNEHKINTICWVVSALTMVSSLGVLETNPPKYLSTVAFGSEVFPLPQYRLWREALPGATFFNLYGPTEATGMSCYWKAERELADGEPIPIGRPFRNTDLFLLGERDEKIEQANKPGEIYLRGTCVTLGYYNNPEKTSEAFVQNPLQNHYPELVYKTGDNAYYNELGELIFVGRKDAQIKHMGHRIELGEIEAAAATVNGLQLCCALYDEAQKQIALFYTGLVDEKTILSELSKKLPRYMLPTRLERLPKMPLTPNGKIDRRGLKERFLLQTQN